MKKIFYTIVAYIGLTSTALAGYKDNIAPSPDKSIITTGSKDGNVLISGIAKYIVDTLFGILVVVWTWAFLFLGAKLLMARGNPEEFKKNLMWLVYGMIWIALMTVAYAIVTFVTKINI